MTPEANTIVVFRTRRFVRHFLVPYFRPIRNESPTMDYVAGDWPLSKLAIIM